jgi:serine O-acetyltransferase
MKENLSYIKFCLRNNIQNYPQEKFDTIAPFWDISLKQTMVDVNVKFNNKFSINTEEELISLAQTDPTVEAVLFYRLERNIFLDNPENPLLPYLASTMKRRTGCEIYYSTKIGEGFNIQHGFGIVIGPRYNIGTNFFIHQGVTLGQKNINSPNENITIGNNVAIYAGAKILGNINIGDNAKIGANAVIIKDVEENSTYAGVPAKRIR